MENTRIKTTSSANGSEIAKSGRKRTMQSSQLMKLFVDELMDIYWAENAMVKAIPKMIENSTSEKLHDALTAHLNETKVHLSRLEKVFALINMKAEGEKCKATEGLIDEAADIMKDCEEGCMRDAGIISAAQKIEHYEIATYGTLRQFAETLGMVEVEKLLATSLQEEKDSDVKLTEVAVNAINVEAAELKV